MEAVMAVMAVAMLDLAAVATAVAVRQEAGSVVAQCTREPCQGRADDVHVNRRQCNRYVHNALSGEA